MPYFWAGGVDKALLLWINQDWAHPLGDLVFTGLSSRVVFALPVMVLILILWWRRFKLDGVRLWLTLLLLIGITNTTGDMLKSEVRHARPCEDIPHEVRQPGRAVQGVACGAKLTGWPSIHALNFFAMAGFVAVVLRRRAWTIAAVLAAALVALSRVYLAKHYPSQVLAGAGLGLLLGALAGLLALKYLGFAQRCRSKVAVDRYETEKSA